MMSEYEAVIGLEVHAELQTQTKMFCSCPVVDLTAAPPNTAVCPVCAGLPGVLPVVNQRAVEFALRVALALECDVAQESIFARKNYFYPDLPKGYQISQYEQPLAVHGHLVIFPPTGPRTIRIRRVHLEEDTGKLTHVHSPDGDFSLVDLNRAGIPLLEIVSEPDLHSGAEVRAYALALHSLLRYLGVNSGDLEKGVLRIEPNVSVRPVGSQELGTRTEIKNLNSFRALERAVAYEIQRQSQALDAGRTVIQETRGWDEASGATFSQRSKEEAEDYRYFPEPDLPPLIVTSGWLEEVRASLPELPAARLRRFQDQYGLSAYDASVLTSDPATAGFYEDLLAALPQAAPTASPKLAANWLTGELFALLNQGGTPIEHSPVSPAALAGLLGLVSSGQINTSTGKAVLAEMFATGRTAREIVAEKDLGQISDAVLIAQLVRETLAQHPEQVESYLHGKEAVAGWLLGQVMRRAQSQANPQMVQQELQRQLAQRRSGSL
jgi:aspartyl-tRNA(Asn)/glutamyl-tRNA(Gln) amidotransferase subunit B